MDTANHEQNMHRTEVADELKQTNNVLASLPPPPMRPSRRASELAPIVRGKLREHMTWLEQSMSSKYPCASEKEATESDAE
jgi:hypothetical protein